MGRSATATWFGGYRSALRGRDLRLLFGGLVISATGSWAYNVALLAFVFSRTHSLTWVGAAGLGRFVPALLLSTYGGVVAERAERIRLMVGADLGCALWQVALAISGRSGCSNASRGPQRSPRKRRASVRGSRAMCCSRHSRRHRHRPR